MNKIAVYANAYPGDYPATFVGTQTAELIKGRPRLLFQFLLLTDDQKAPRRDNQGNDLFAVAVCNPGKGTNPKSKPYKIRRAMLEQGDCDPIEEAFAVPAAEFFTEKRKDGTRRTVEIRVASRNGVAVVTDIKSPRDGSWTCIEGTYEGSGPAKRSCQETISAPQCPKPEPKPVREIPTASEAELWDIIEEKDDAPTAPKRKATRGAIPPKFALDHYFWINPDGSVLPDTPENEERMQREAKGAERRVWSMWNNSFVWNYEGEEFFEPDGKLKEPKEVYFGAKNPAVQVSYQLERMWNELEFVSEEEAFKMAQPFEQKRWQKW